ncbi:MAG: CHAD domain-containing protein [Chlorobiaceae bacterium]|nr:CHAD domain-containing protein [Chlorobiaceae bacterium]
MKTLSETLYLRVSDNSPLDLPDGNSLPSGWSIRKNSSYRERHLFYDTFEEQAFNRGLIVARKKGCLQLIDLDTGMVKAEIVFPGTPTTFFPSALPDGKLRSVLEQCSRIRAFIRTCVVDVFVSSWKVLDDDKKTVAILNSESMQGTRGNNSAPFAKFFTITPLKGYHRELANILKALPEQIDSYRIMGVRDRFLMIMKETGPATRGYSPKMRLQLDADATIHENVRRLLQFTTSIMQLNEHGIRKNVDSEFLHDYRVAIRRTRSMLSLLNGVLAPDQTELILSGLRDLGKRTNELRDCDVFLLRKNEYCRLLPPTLRESLSPFFEDLESARRILHKRLCLYLSSDEYVAFMASLNDFIGQDELPEQESAPKSALSTKVMAATALRKAWKKALSHGRRIGTDADDRALHALRIDCKKLRYLLEFFSSLFPQKSAIRLGRQLKELQENLGTFVDMTVQLKFLQNRLDSLQAGEGKIMEAAATGALLASLYREQEKARERFHETFIGFDNEETGNLFDEIVTSLQ